MELELEEDMPAALKSLKKNPSPEEDRSCIARKTSAVHDLRRGSAPGDCEFYSLSGEFTS
eukprot:391686-Prorocentrum_minimum.AAC.1